jgi:2-dehydro-3-deoxy-D-arabinonate dehydratase
MVDLARYYEPGSGPRWGLIESEEVYDIGDALVSLAAWLRATVGDVAGAIERLQAAALEGEGSFRRGDLSATPDQNQRHLLAPTDQQEIWAAGVTYERSRLARQEEAQDGGDVYARVYASQRPELFFKAYAEKAVGPGAAVGIRQDATWSVPEPELALALNPALEVAGLTIGNDLSSRDIEGANPLYLPQAKVYTASCALGPHIRLAAIRSWPELTIAMQIVRRGEVVFNGESHTRHLHRSLLDLTDYLGRSNSFPNGAILLTGTGIVPPPEFTLMEGDVVTIEIESLGQLSNPVRVV